MKSIALLFATGCAVGGGPLIGVGQRSGVFVGAEINGGLMFAQAAATYQSAGNTVYIRADATIDAAGIHNGRRDSMIVRPGGRLGIGQVLAGDGDLVFAGGINGGYVLEEASPCSAMFPVAVLAVDVRHMNGEWQIVASPRIEAHAAICASDAKR